MNNEKKKLNDISSEMCLQTLTKLYKKKYKKASEYFFSCMKKK